MNHCMKGTISYSALYNLSDLFKYHFAPPRAFNILFVQIKITTNKNKDGCIV